MSSFARYDPDARPVHDAAGGGGESQRISTALWWGRRDVQIMRHTRARIMSFVCDGSSGVSEGAIVTRGARLADALPRVGLRAGTQRGVPRWRTGVLYAIDFMNPAPDADVHSAAQKKTRLDCGQ